MPEGHTIHALARRLNRAYADLPVRITSPQGRFAESAALLDGTRFVRAQAAGKNLFVELEQDRWLHVHLGLIGNFAVTPVGDGIRPDDVPVQGEVRLRVSSAEHVADLRGPMVCALVTPDEVASVIGRLGPDPLRPDADPEQAWDRISRSRKTIAELLLDQAVVAGVGNVYRCEVLWRHRLDPRRPGRELRRASWDLIWADLVRLLPLGVAFGQILTLEDQVVDAEARVAAGEVPPELTGRALGTTYPREFATYKRTGEPCLRCASRIRSEKLGGRELYWCGRCQRRR
ncbi:Fpg/Nei family DNA glycosylase [Arsenicicoccus sp. oral taxon 190]|uniref:Fpg/Nei family DNA glycosylase n=1 Tax=Arsenicicoccus sp. oral taxon 190 TaxID=1658671 RepID=UPI000679EB70|nr:DNA-formamidopyrimidine glycosylase family protein [Arsenicicoccus sp. oral taxon 190]AKT50521.1 DNA glycosylase [Arsenicicoccus sp. oral taxon 190]